MGRKRITLEDLDIRRDGTIYYNGEPKKFFKHKDGYLRTWLDGKNPLIHRLVAQKYIPNPENKPEVNHINGDKTDNRVKNLEWVTNRENMRHAFDTGLNCNKYKRKLTMKEVSEIRNKYVPRKYTQKMLSEEYGVHRYTISEIVRNINYKEEVDTTNIFLTN